MRTLFLLALLLTPVRAEAPVLVAAASSLGPPLRELAGRFSQTQGLPVKLVLASSGKLLVQIQKGAPYDLYLPADPAYLERLPKERLKAETRPFARGRLALYLNPRLGLAPSGPGVLRDPRVRRVAVANPGLAPYGRAAVALMRRHGLYPEVEAKLVYAENVAQAARLAAFAADAGWIDLGAARRLGGPYWLAPKEDHPPLLYAAGLLRERGRAFFAFLQGPEARAVLARYGLEAP